MANILAKGTKLREHAKGVENNIRQVELDSIQVCDVLCDLIFIYITTIGNWQTFFLFDIILES